MAFDAACTKKMSNATPVPTTGAPYMGICAAAVSVLANNIPVVACNPTMVAPSPMTFTVSPVLRVRMTSVRGGTKSRSFDPLRSLSPNRTTPSDQTVVKYPATKPNRIKYNPASVLLVKPLYRNENTTITAATVVSTSWDQNDQRPRDLHARAVRGAEAPITQRAGEHAVRVLGDAGERLSDQGWIGVHFLR